MNIQYKIDEVDKVFDEKGNTFLALRKISWGDKSDAKLDLRKWYISKDGTETVGKGFSFLTEDGPHDLVNVLLETGYGRTKDVIENIKDREDFIPSLVSVIGKEKIQEMDVEVNIDENVDDDLYDPKVLFY